MTKLFYILSLLIIKVASNYISTHLWSGEKKLKKRVLLQTLILTACFLPTHGQDSFLCFQTNVQKSNISIHEQRMKHPGHSQTACVHSKHIGIGNEDTGNDHGAGKTKYNKSVPFLALKTNMLFDIALIPNIEVEVPVGKCWSLNGELMFPWWLFDNDKYCMQILSGGLETRYWLDNKKKRNILTGHFAGLYAGGGKYDLHWKENGYQGEFFIAAGISYGYAKRISRNLHLEFNLGIGVLRTYYKHYHANDNHQTLLWQNNGRYTWFGPTKAKISLAWILNHKVKGGVK